MSIYTKIFKNNIDIVARMEQEQVKTKYLKEDDVLLISLEGIEESDSIELADGLLIIHYIPESYRIIGFTVPYVKEFLDTFKPFTRKENKEAKITPSAVASAGLTGLSFAF